MKNLYCFVGLSGSGKSTIVQHLMEEFEGTKEVLSYTDRPRRGKDDKSHIFLSRREADEFLNEIKSNELSAYTEIDGCRYFATIEQVMYCDYYVIDEVGLLRLKEMQLAGLLEKKFYVIKIKTDYEVARERMIRRDGRIRTSMRLSFDYVKRQEDFENLQCDLEITNNDSDCLAINVKKIAEFIKEKEGF